MDWNLLSLSFVTVFISELGDKSQLAAIALSSNAKSLRAVFLGAASALLVASFVGVWIGEGTAQLLPIRWVKAIAAIGFALMAVRLLWPPSTSSLISESSDEGTPHSASSDE